MWRLMRQERERGATAIIVALSLVLLLGAVGMAVDMGASYAKRQELQNAADAAALAAAQEVAANGWDGAEGGVAEDYAVANVRNNKPSVTADVTQLSSTRLRVVTEGVQEHWFIRVLGIDQSTVRAQADAEMGSPYSGVVVPIAFSVCEFDKNLASSPVETARGLRVSIWMPNNAAAACQGKAGVDEDYPPGGFGWLPSDPGGDCATTVTVSHPTDESTWYPSDTGVSPPSGCDSDDIRLMVGQTVLLPIFDKFNGKGGSNARYRVSQFAAFEVVGSRSHTGSGGPWGEGCGNSDRPTWNVKNTCFSGYFKGYVGLDSEFVLGPDLTDVIIIRLVD